MILTAQVKPENAASSPQSLTSTQRAPTTVEQDVNPLYWRLIREFGNRTGVPVVMNTSFNLRGEPIARLPPMRSAHFLALAGCAGDGSLWRKIVLRANVSCFGEMPYMPMLTSQNS